MAENKYSFGCDYLCERRLRQIDESLHERFRTSVFAMDLLLANYKNIFPFYTDHTFEHSEQVINYCNIIAGEEIVGSLNSDEIYIMLMGASLHDVGMGISESDFSEMRADVPGLIEYMQLHPDLPLGEYTREFHQEFSATFIKKYSPLFDVPSEEHIYCISQVAKGHRRADMLDKAAFPSDYLLKNGRRVNLAYITALVKLADELDVAADRNLMFDYGNIDESWSEKQTMCYKCHGAIKSLGVVDDSLVLYYSTSEPQVEEEIINIFGKVGRTLDEYAAVVEKRTDFKNRFKSVLLQRI